jgi:DNA-binding CsgD family transcriptional regulator
MPTPLANGLFDLVNRINAAPTIPMTWEIFMSAARDVGLSFGIACFFPNNKNIGETIFASEVPKEWIGNYIEKNYQEVDPLLRKTQNAVRPISWRSNDWDGFLNDRQKSWQDDNNAVGIKNGFVIPDCRDGHSKLIGISGDTGKIAPNDEKVLYYAGLETLARMHELGLQNGERPFQPLSPRECECLQWVAAGKSDWDIGHILSISEKTVATHIDRVKHKLGVATRAQAIVIALRHGILGF